MDLLSSEIVRVLAFLVGIIAFAGESRMLTPMTMNYSTLEIVLDGINTKTLWRPGTDISQAIKIQPLMLPSGPGLVVTTISLTPAILAGVTDMSTVEG